MRAPPPLSLYVHLPWCVRKCPYCDFNSYGLKGTLPEGQYVEALTRDIAAQAADAAGREIASVFFGGGTPSLFSPDAIGRILGAAREAMRLAPDVEITLEANPGTVERGRFAEYRAAGVDRVSLGAQSFDAAQLAALGRIHSPDETRRAAEELHAAGIGNFNLDLMYGLPGQSPAEAAADVASAIALSPAHLSHYQLTIEPGTVFAAHPPSLPQEETIDAMLEGCLALLERAGFARYEVSAYCRPDRRCRHNLNYWGFGDYLGVGAGAHGKLTDPRSGLIVRTAQPRDPRRYVAGVPGMTRRAVEARDLPFEFMLNALRLMEGFEEGDFEARTGLAFGSIAQRMQALRGRGLLQREGARWSATPFGQRFLNDVIAEFLPEAGSRTPPKALSIPATRYAQASGAGTANEQITCESGQLSQ